MSAVPVGLDALTLIQSVADTLAPRMQRVDDFTASMWLRDINPDPWWIAVMICDAATGQGGTALANARKPSYLTAVLRERADTPSPLAKPEDAKFFVERTIAAIQRQRTETP